MDRNEAESLLIMVLLRMRDFMAVDVKDCGEEKGEIEGLMRGENSNRHEQPLISGQRHTYTLCHWLLVSGRPYNSSVGYASYSTAYPSGSLSQAPRTQLVRDIRISHNGLGHLVRCFIVQYPWLLLLTLPSSI